MNAAADLARLPALLLPWFAANARDLPWRRDREPYHVWLSEIMLQQTRVEAVKGYYARFLAALPDLPALAAADMETLRKLWEGLGYYSRVRNLHAAAVQIMTEHGGVFPSEYAAIRALRGVGDYTAGAIASICFGLPTPAVDGNVLRVVARLTGDTRPVTDAACRNAFREALRAVYPPGRCGDFTQALMELGAVVCVPGGAPACSLCPAADFCAARDGLWRTIPVRAAKKARRQEALTVLALRCAGALALRRRPERGLLAGLWEMPNLPGHLEPQEALDQAQRWGLAPAGLTGESRRSHIFTHVEWDMRCYYLECRRQSGDFFWADEGDLQRRVALPSAFRKLLPGPAPAPCAAGLD